MNSPFSHKFTQAFLLTSKNMPLSQDKHVVAVPSQLLQFLSQGEHTPSLGYEATLASSQVVV